MAMGTGMGTAFDVSGGGSSAEKTPPKETNECCCLIDIIQNAMEYFGQNSILPRDDGQLKALGKLCQMEKNKNLVIIYGSRGVGKSEWLKFCKNYHNVIDENEYPIHMWGEQSFSELQEDAEKKLFIDGIDAYLLQYWENANGENPFADFKNEANKIFDFLIKQSENKKVYIAIRSELDKIFLEKFLSLQDEGKLQRRNVARLSWGNGKTNETIRRIIKDLTRDDKGNLIINAQKTVRVDCANNCRYCVSKSNFENEALDALKNHIKVGEGRPDRIFAPFKHIDISEGCNFGNMNVHLKDYYLAKNVAGEESRVQTYLKDCLTWCELYCLRKKGKREALIKEIEEFINKTLEYGKADNLFQRATFFETSTKGMSEGECNDFYVKLQDYLTDNVIISKRTNAPWEISRFFRFLYEESSDSLFSKEKET